MRSSKRRTRRVRGRRDGRRGPTRRQRGGAASAQTAGAGAATTIAAVNNNKTSQPGPGPSQCHPAVGKKTPAHGCLPIEVLKKAAQKLGIKGASDKDLRMKLESALKLQKPGERTFLYALPLSEKEKVDLARDYLRPALPKDWLSDPDQWLDSLNISDVMNQYEKAYPHFEFMGPYPIDFAAPDPYEATAGVAGVKCLIDEICNLRVKKALENGQKSIGIVYNLDPHYKSGSHWVANYIDIVGHKCYYFDSYGMAPPKQVAKFMKWLTTQDPKMELVYNARRLQFKDSECGVYSIYFIIRMLEGDEFTDITRRKPKDEDMLDFRDWLYST